MTATTLQREVGIETIPHLTPRDTSVMGLEGVLLGAHADGVRNVLAVTGDPPHVGDYPGSRGVYEVDSIGLVQLISGLNRGEDYVGKGLDAPTSFFVGVAVNPSADDLELELDRFRRKVDAGRSLRDDAGALRPRAARPLRRAARRRVADPRAARGLAAAQPRDGAPAAQRGAGDLGSRRRCSTRCRSQARTHRRSASTSRAASSRSRASAWRGSTSSLRSSSRSARSTCSPEVH